MIKRLIGTPLLIALVFMGALGGVYTGNWRLSVFGAFVMLYVFGTLWLIGCWARGDRE